MIRKSIARWSLAAFLVCLAGAPAMAGEWKFPLSIAYTSGLYNVTDWVENQIGHTDDSFIWPIGLAFGPYYEFDHGSRIGLEIGPTTFYLLTVDYGYTEEDYVYWDLPVSVTYGFTFLPRSSVSPYARLGVRYHVVGGDFDEGSSPGGFGAIGVDFSRLRKVGMAFEVAYDASEVELGSPLYSEEVKPGEVVVSFKVVF